MSIVNYFFESPSESQHYKSEVDLQSTHECGVTVEDAIVSRVIAHSDEFDTHGVEDVVYSILSDIAEEYWMSNPRLFDDQKQEEYNRIEKHINAVNAIASDIIDTVIIGIHTTAPIKKVIESDTFPDGTIIITILH